MNAIPKSELVYAFINAVYLCYCMLGCVRFVFFPLSLLFVTIIISYCYLFCFPFLYLFYICFRFVCCFVCVRYPPLDVVAVMLIFALSPFPSRGVFISFLLFFFFSPFFRVMFITHICSLSSHVVFVLYCVSSYVVFAFVLCIVPWSCSFLYHVSFHGCIRFRIMYRPMLCSFCIMYRPMLCSFLYHVSSHGRVRFRIMYRPM